MLLEEFIVEGRDAPLYHGFNNPTWAGVALKNNELLATSTQRFWGDGKRRKDNDPEYEGSYWMKGVSFTRDIRFATSWGRVVIKIDQAKLARKVKIIPFNWGYSIPNPTSGHKREREEFAVVKSTLDRYDNDDGGKDLLRFRSPEGSITGLNDMLLGIYLCTDIASLDEKNYLKGEFEKSGMTVDELIAHPKFLGYFENDRFRPFKMYSPRADRSLFRP